MFSDYRRDLGPVSLLLCIWATMLLYAKPLQAQNSVGIGTNSPNKHAVLELTSPNNNQGLLLPRLTTAQRTNPAFTATLTPTDNGLIIFDKNTNQFYYWKDNQWIEIGARNTSASGSVWHSGAGLPADNLGTSGDFYLDTTQGNIYQKEEGKYKLAMKLTSQPGPQGLPGLKGDKGDTGAQGLQGIKGGNGAAGAKGDTGSQGITGLQGIKGDTGAPGAAGPQGIKGDKGDKGDTGATGSQGPAGTVSTLTDGKILVGNAAKSPTEVTISQDAQLSNTGALTVTGLHNTPLAAIEPTNGQVLQMNGSTWTPTTLDGVLSGGTTDYLPKWSSATSLTSSTVFDNGTDVGIGTTMPDAALHIKKDGPICQEVSMLILEANSGGLGNGPVLHFRNKPSFVNYLGAIAVLDSSLDARMEFRVSNDNISSLSPLTRSATRMVIVDNGNVGIGNNNPGQKLSVAGTLGIIETGISPSNYTIFRGGAQSKNITYTLPTDAPTADGQVLTATTAGVMSWSTSGTATHIIKLTLNVDVGGIPSKGYLYHNFTVPGATMGSSVFLSPEGDLPDNIVIAYARVSAADTVTVKFVNTSNGNQYPGAMNYYISVIK
ncbi:MAG: hypothetical protein V4714_17200 [Bacteroidota bacterium]